MKYKIICIIRDRIRRVTRQQCFIEKFSKEEIFNINTSTIQKKIEKRLSSDKSYEYLIDIQKL